MREKQPNKNAIKKHFIYKKINTKVILKQLILFFLLLNEELANSLHTLINFINHYYLRMHHLLEKSFKERHLLYIRPTAVIHDFIKNKTKIKFFVKKPLFLLYIYQTIIYLTFTKKVILYVTK